MSSLEKYIKNNNIKINNNNKTINISETSSLGKYIKKNNININNNKSLSTTKISSKKDDQEWYEGIFKSGAYADGYQKGDYLKTVGSSIGDVGVNLVKGVGGLVEGVGDLATYGIADVVGTFGNETKANQMRANAKKSTVDELFQPLESAVDKNSVFDDKADDVVKTLGYVAGMTAVGVLSGGTASALGVTGTAALKTAATLGTTTTTFTSAMGNSMTEALNDGATLEESRIYGAISGAGEALSELMFGGLGKISGAMGLSKGALDDVLVGGLTKGIKNKLTKTIIQSGLKAGGEGFEEVVSGFISGAAKRMTYMKEEQGENFFDTMVKIWKDDKLAEQFWMGTLTSVISQSPSTIVSGVRGTDYLTGRTENEQKVYDSELKTRKETKTKEATIEKAYNEQIKAQENLGVKLTEEAKAEIRQKVENAYENGTIENIELSKKELNAIEEQLDTDMEEGNISEEGIRKALGENFDVDKKKDKILMRSMYENAQKYEDYKVEKTDNEKVNILMQSAADAGMNNTSKTRKKIELIAKLTKDTDRQYKFVSSEQLKQMGYNENANGCIDKSTGEILINYKKSGGGLQIVVGHETTHIFDSKDANGKYSTEYEELQKAIFEYAKVKGVYDARLQSVNNAYREQLLNENEIKEELTADLVGEFLFNDEAFIEQLSVKNKNIFQKIYDYIKHAYTMAKGTDEEKAFEELKNKFEKVYKTVGQETSTDIKYSVGGKQALKNIKDSTIKKEAYDNYKKAKQMAQNKESNEKIFKETGWYKDKVTGKMKFNFSDKDMKIVNKNYKVGQEYRLEDILIHDTLFQIYPQLRNYKVKIADINKNKSKNETKINGQYNKFTKELTLDINTFRNTSKADGTLIHEIQHAIQRIEGFAGGTSIQFGKKRYKNSPGEIEARDTARRMIHEKYNDNDLSNVMPKSANVDTTIVEKMKIGLFNYLTGVSNSEDIDTKQKQLDIILKTNPMQDDYHTGIRTVEDIKTFDEVINDDESFVWGDFSQEDAKKALEKGTVTVYSSKPIENGNFISTSRNMARDYSGNGKIYSKEVPLKYVAWINGDEGQYAKVDDVKYSLSDNQGRTLTKEQQEYFKDSKVRDEDGNLLTVYHGTKQDFTVFENKLMGKNAGNALGEGYYFTSHKPYAEMYKNLNNTDNKGKVLETYIDIKNPLDKSTYNANEMIEKVDEIVSVVEPTREQNNPYYSLHRKYVEGKLNTFAGFIDYVKGFSTVQDTTSNEIFSKLGYDGIINGKEYVVFNSNQVKNVDNLNPTESDDIRHSLTKDTPITGDDIAIRDMLKQERPTIEDEIGKTEAPTVEEVITQTPEEKEQGMKEKAKKYLSRSKTRFIKKIVEDFGTSKIANTKTLNAVVDSIREDIQKNGPLTKEKADGYFNELYNNLVTIDTLYYDTYKDVKDNIRATKLYISDEIKSDITDYNEFRKRNMGTLLMTSDMNNLSVDSYYQEMSDLYPELFPEDIINPSDQLERISEVAKDITKVETNVAAYNDKYLGPDYKEWARVEFDKNINAFMKDIQLAERYNAETNDKPKYGVDKETAEQIYKQLPGAKKAYERALSRELLTDKDLVQVDRLIKNEITKDEIPKGLNKKGIIKVAEAKYEYHILQEMAREYERENIPTRKEVKKRLLKKMGITEKDIAVGEDISSFNMQITDPIRLNEKVFGKELGTKINDATINETKHNTAEKIRWQNKERKEIKELGIKARSKESAAVQKYGEKKYVDENGKTQKYGDVELAKEFSDVETQEKIKNAAQVIRSKYDAFLEQANSVLTSLGYNQIPKREDYMRHFQELTDKFSQVGVPLNLNDMKADDLPTDINGLTAFNQPGKNWFASALQRTGEKTTLDAITGIDGYIEGVGNLIFHTGDIQNYRALSGMIRDTYGQQHGLDNKDNMTPEEIEQRIKDIQDNKLSKYVAWLDEQANSLAGKKGFIDRGFETMFGRKIYNVINTAKKQVGSNMTGFNVRSSLTNLISTALAASKTNKMALANGTVSTISNMFKQDDFIDKSDFLTSRFGSDTLSQKFWQKASNVGQIFMTGTDWFTSNIIVRSKYYEGLSKNMTESEAIKYADDFASRVMGDRSQGATSEIFNSKTLGLLTQFQLEVNNQWQFMVHDTKMDYQQNKEENSGLKAGATAIFQMGQLAAYSYFFNELFEKVTGSRAAFDPIEIIKTLFGLDDDDDDEKTFDERLAEAGGLLVDNIPFANLFTDGGRIPVSEAFTGASTLLKKVTGGTDEYGNAITWEDVKDDTLATIPYWVMPTGYSQAKKTVKGLSMYSNDVPGSYTDSGNLRYTVEEDVGSKVQAALFGAYANPYAQDYIDSGYKTINKDNIDEMVGLDMNSTEYRQFKSNISKVSDTSDANGYKQYTDDNGKVYWYDSDTETMYDSNYKKTTLTEDDLTKVSKKEEALNYIDSLDLTDKQKNLVANNLNKDSKKKIDMSEYGNYSSYDEYKYARDYPEKYSVVSQISAYDDYVKYKDKISDIKKQYSTELGYESDERKEAITNYIESQNLNKAQKIMLYKMAGGYSIKSYKNYMYDYIESLPLSKEEKYTMWEELFN